MVGTALLNQLVNDNRYSEIVSIGRHKPTVESSKITHFDNDLQKPKTAAEHLFGDDLFICIGTTIHNAGSQEAFKFVDLTIPKKLAKHARNNGVKNVAVVSAIGANRKSNNFYLRTKGKLEKEIVAHSFDKTIIVRPSLLMGHREEFRLGEALGKVFSGIMKLFLCGKYRKYRAIEAEKVARAMIYYINTDHRGVDFIKYDQIVDLR